MSESVVYGSPGRLFLWLPYCLFNSAIIVKFARRDVDSKENEWINRAAFINPIILLVLCGFTHYFSAYDTFAIEKSNNLFLKAQVACFILQHFCHFMTFGEDHLVNKLYKICRSHMLDLFAVSPLFIYGLFTLNDVVSSMAPSQSTSDAIDPNERLFSIPLMLLFIADILANVVYPQCRVDIEKFTKDPNFGIIVLLTLGLALVFYIAVALLVQLIYIFPYIYVLGTYLVCGSFGIRRSQVGYAASGILVFDSIIYSLILFKVADTQIDLSPTNKKENNNNNRRQTDSEKASTSMKDFGNSVVFVLILSKLAVAVALTAFHLFKIFMMFYPYLRDYVSTIFFKL